MKTQILKPMAAALLAGLVGTAQAQSRSDPLVDLGR